MLGANDGSRHDPAFPLLVDRGYGGIFCEGVSDFKARLFANLRPFNTSGNLRVVWGLASAELIGATLLRHGCPREPDALKIDTDGIDAALLEGVLTAGIRPKAVVVEVNPDIPPPIQLVQLDHRDFTFDFKTKHMRGWLGASADGLFALMDRHEYALLAFEFGTREHLVCVSKAGTRRICRKAHTCTHCENNMWFVRSDLLRASGAEPLTWPQFVNGFWRQLFAFNTFRENSRVFSQQNVNHDGHFTESDEHRPYRPECYSLSDHQFTPRRRRLQGGHADRHGALARAAPASSSRARRMVASLRRRTARGIVEPCIRVGRRDRGGRCRRRIRRREGGSGVAPPPLLRR